MKLVNKFEFSSLIDKRSCPNHPFLGAFFMSACQRSALVFSLVWMPACLVSSLHKSCTLGCR